MADLIQLLGDDESETVERKETWGDDCLKALAALANSVGGTLLVGVSDTGKVEGWPGDGKDQERVSSQITSALQVHPVSMSVSSVGGKQLLAIRMAKAASPVALRGRYFRRVGNSSREVPAEELPRFLLERTGQSWDSVPCDFSLDWLSTKSIDDFKSLARARLPKMAPSDGALTIVNNLRLQGADDRLIRAAIMLFGRDPQRLVTSAQVQIARFKGDSTILDDTRIEGNLFEQVHGSIEALRRLLTIRYEVRRAIGDRRGAAAMQREEVWEYPFDALREGIVNALIHRDYTSTGRVQIRIYDDRLMIVNPGGLPNGLTVEDLLRESHDSLPRNPILAQVFYYAGLVEQWGSGTTRMVEACRTRELPDPRFESTETTFTLTFRKDALTDVDLRAGGLNARQIRAVRYIQVEGSISNSEYQALTSVSRRSASYDLISLEKAGIVVRSGRTGRSVRYVLIVNAQIAQTNAQ